MGDDKLVTRKNQPRELMRRGIEGLQLGDWRQFRATREQGTAP
jgi:hypothetical protein